VSEWIVFICKTATTHGGLAPYTGIEMDAANEKERVVGLECGAVHPLGRCRVAGTVMRSSYLTSSCVLVRVM
jgi:hypothetical protein